MVGDGGRVGVGESNKIGVGDGWGGSVGKGVAVGSFSRGIAVFAKRAISGGMVGLE